MTKKLTLEELLEFLNTTSIDSSMEWEAPHLYEDTTFQIRWIYDKQTLDNFYVRVKEDEDEDWLNVGEKDLIALLIANKADLSKFELQLLKTICSQTSCCYYYIEQVKALIGKEKTEKITSMVDEIIKKKQISSLKKSKPKLRIIDKNNP